jgi:hypothetical protein
MKQGSPAQLAHFFHNGVIPFAQVNRFTSEHKEMFTDAAVVCITTYTMIAYSGRRSEDAEKVHVSSWRRTPLQASCGVSLLCI